MEKIERDAKVHTTYPDKTVIGILTGVKRPAKSDFLFLRKIKGSKTQIALMILRKKYRLIISSSIPSFNEMGKHVQQINLPTSNFIAECYIASRKCLTAIFLIVIKY